MQTAPAYSHMDVNSVDDADDQSQDQDQGQGHHPQECIVQDCPSRIRCKHRKGTAPRRCHTHHNP